MLENRKLNPKGRRYSDDIKKFATTLYFYSSKAYNYVRSVLCLPNPSSLRNWASNIDANTGFLLNVLTETSKFSMEDKYCCLIIDSMSIKKSVQWDKVHHKYVGYCDYGKEMTVEDCETPASEVLVFMLSSLKKMWKWPIGYWFVDKIKSTVQSQLIKIALTHCEKFDIKVKSITCDGAYANSSTLQHLGCNLNQEYDNIQCSFNVISTGSIIHFIPDACHNVKLARNALGTFKAFKDDNRNLIEWRFIEQLFKIQYELGFKLGNKLGSAHIHWKANTMKVKLAVQTLSSSVADALQFLQQEKKFQNSDATIKFIRTIDEIFDFLNSRNTFAKGYKQPITLKNIIYLEERMINHIKYLYSLRTVTGQELWKSRRKTFILGFAASIKSTVSIAKDLLTRHNFKFILTYKFSQDALELFFGHMRGRFGYNNNPNCLEFKYALRSILLHNAIKLSNGNCSLLTPVEDSLFALKWNTKKSSQHLNEEEIEEPIKLLSKHYKDSTTYNEKCTLQQISENILYYISGYVIHKLVSELKCKYCIDAITDCSNRPDHTYCNQTRKQNSFKTLTNLKNRGGLNFASESVFKIIKLTEEYFKSLLVDKKQLFIKNLDLRIMLAVQNTLALSPILQECKKCIEITDIYCRPHKLDLINKICLLYLKIRLHSYSHILTSEVMKESVSRRQKLHKTILFYNM